MSTGSPAPPLATRCPACGSDVGSNLRACPGCGRLVHAAEMSRLAAEAQAAEARADGKAAMGAWRQILELLPPDSAQATQIAAHVAELSRGRTPPPLPVKAPPLVDEPAASASGDARQRRDASPHPASGRKPWWKLAGAAIVGAILKFKTLVFVVLAKAKFLVLGLSKLTTLLSMFAFFGVYWALFGWWFAAGLVVSIYIHEMGHVHALVRRGFPASAPMFIPGLGAFVRLGQRPVSVIEDARIGLAGPFWGLGAAVAFAIAWRVTGSAALAAIAHVAAWINLFNLLPVWQLDGSRGMASLVRWQRAVVVLGFALGWALSRDPFLAVLGIAALVRTVMRNEATEPDNVGLAGFVGLILTLSGLVRLTAK